MYPTYDISLPFLFGQSLRKKKFDRVIWKKRNATISIFYWKSYQVCHKVAEPPKSNLKMLLSLTFNTWQVSFSRISQALDRFAAHTLSTKPQLKNGLHHIYDV